MTREETIVNLENLIALFHTASEQSKVVDYSKIIETLEFAAAALRPVSREQVEKVWRAHWRESTQLGGFVYCSHCGYSALEANNYTFCPKCGRPFTDEAVEMVMERMETIR